ncbi:Methionine ABC transporter ATP-binding protein [Minicystis rosea]|nr:Methionine ABC transporter ATP-binding protein [Minicystis rosea]
MENLATKPDEPRGEGPMAKRKPLSVAVITGDPRFYAAAVAACADAVGEVVIDGALADPSIGPEAHPLHREAVSKARRYLAKQPPAVTIVQAGTLEDAAARLVARGPSVGPLGMVFLDGGAGNLERDPLLEDRLETFYAHLAESDVASVRSPYSVVLHRRTPPWSEGVHALGDRVIERVLDSGSPWLLRTEMLIALVDFVERTFEKPRNHKAALRDLPTPLGEALTRFLGDRAGSEWLFFYYTGSSVTPLIDHVERAARAQGAFALRAANEHGLASGAMANHLLHGRPFLCVVGTAMMDELRGTLANLRSAGARGFIVCPEADVGSWFSFQGTITADEDMREAIAARRLPCVYLDRVETMRERLEEAFRLYEEARGPVVLLVTQAILDARDPLPQAPLYPARHAPQATLSSAQEEALGRAVDLLNHERTKVLFQLGRLDEEESELVHRIAERAGVALVDTLGHPHPTHRHGRRVKYHLGTLGLYGFNQRSYAFLHDASGKLHPKTEQCIFFLKSRVGGRATNFTPARRSGLRMIQLTNRADHVAPDVDLAVVMDAKDFLGRVLDRLDVDPEVRRHRDAAIEASAEPRADLQSRIPSLPMSPNYFFRALGDLFERMIEDDGHSYTGVYDVGRSSVSATRAVPRTRRGFSGWYGRALMGDAPAALPALAVTEPGHLVAFVGDGAKSIVADPIPPLLDNALAYPARFDKNITLFYFSNGTFSGIRTYRERLASKWGGRQMRTIDLLAPDGERRIGPLTVVHRTLTSFDAVALREALLARGRLNVFTVLLGHNNDDDGFSFVTAGWQRDAMGG